MESVVINQQACLLYIFLQPFSLHLFSLDTVSLCHIKKPGLYALNVVVNTPFGLLIGQIENQNPVQIAKRNPACNRSDFLTFIGGYSNLLEAI